MFAEPIRHEIQLEQFQVVEIFGAQRVKWDPIKLGIHRSTFDYLARNHYYRDEAHLFLEKIGQHLSTQDKKPRLELVRIVKTDTLVVAKF